MCRRFFRGPWGFWGHLGLDYSLEDPAEPSSRFLLRHVDYGLPGDRANPRYQHSIARYVGMVAPGGVGWPPLRTPRGFEFFATPFRTAPRSVGEFFLNELPRFWGEAGAYRMLGPNSNTGIRAALRACERATGYRFGRPPIRIWLGAIGWSYPVRLSPAEGPYAGYFDDSSRLRWQIPAS